MDMHGEKDMKNGGRLGREVGYDSEFSTEVKSSFSLPPCLPACTSTCQPVLSAQPATYLQPISEAAVAKCVMAQDIFS